MIKKLYVGLISITLIFCLQCNTYATQVNYQSVNIFLNNQKIIFDSNYGFPFIDENNRTQVPFRLVLESFGAEVSWDQENEIAIAEKGETIVKVPIGEKYIYKNDEMIINDTEALILNGRTYLPIRVVMEAFDCDVNWVGEDLSVFIDYNNDSTLINSIPLSYDLRNVNKVSMVKDQGNLGTCWAFASLGAIETILLPNEEIDFSEDNISLTHGYQIPQTHGGDYNIAMSYFARWSGPVLEEEDLYGDGIANEIAVASKHIQESKVIPSKDYLAIKISILMYGGVQSSIYMDSNIIDTESEIYNSETFAYLYSENETINHDVVIVGWDDNYSKENFKVQPQNDGAFICKNSYGEDFGDEGYFYISYEDKYIGSNNIVYSRIDNSDNYSNIYQADWLGWIGRLGYGSDTAYFSNAYEVKSEKEELCAVSFYATDNDTTYEVYVVEDFNNADDFKNMKFLKRGNLQYKGYYTVDFDEPIIVDSKFAVVVKISTPGSSLPVAAEYYKNVPWLNEVNIDDGEGYMSLTGSIWDNTEELLNSNICLKAFTNDIIS